MKILIRKSDNVVIYAQADLQLDESAHGDGWVDNNFNTGNATLLEAGLPEHWTGAVWSYSGSVWAIADQAGYDAHMVQVAADIEAKRVASVPKVVTMRQARLALLGAGLLPGVTAAINAMGSPMKEAAQIEWEYSQTVERQRGFVLLLGAALGLTELQLDNLFVAAGAL